MYFLFFGFITFNGSESMEVNVTHGGRKKGDLWKTANNIQ